MSLLLSEEAAVIRVKDTGIGIEAAFLPCVFNRFSQENSTSTRGPRRTLGHGLAIGRHPVELHHGTGWWRRAPVWGRGATFSVTLPLLKAPQPIPPAPGSQSKLEPAPLDGAPLGGFRILVVDDDRATRDVLLEVLGRTGADVRLAESVAQAMETFEVFHPQLLLSDIAMPGEDGYALIRKVRARGAGRSGAIPAIALTALAHDEDRDRGLASGFAAPHVQARRHGSPHGGGAEVRGGPRRRCHGGVYARALGWLRREVI